MFNPAEEPNDEIPFIAGDSPSDGTDEVKDDDIVIEDDDDDDEVDDDDDDDVIVEDDEPDEVKE